MAHVAWYNWLSSTAVQTPIAAAARCAVEARARHSASSQNTMAAQSVSPPYSATTEGNTSGTRRVARPSPTVNSSRRV